MSKFNRYAREIERIVREACEEYMTVETAYKNAERARNQSPVRTSGFVDAAYSEKSHRAQADYLEAKGKFDAVRRDMDRHNSEIAKLRGELEAELDADYSVDPSQLDSNTLELLKSGILKSGEYAKLLDTAQAAGNVTMARMIGKYADEAAETASSKNGPYDRDAMTLRTVAYKARAFTGSDTLQVFDTIAGAAQYCFRTPSLFNQWDRLVGETVENF